MKAARLRNINSHWKYNRAYVPGPVHYFRTGHSLSSLCGMVKVKRYPKGAIEWNPDGTARMCERCLQKVPPCPPKKARVQLEDEHE